MEHTHESGSLVYVRFPVLPTAYIFDAKGLELSRGDLVVVNTEAGQSSARVVGFPTAEDATGLGEIKPVLRKINDGDRRRMAANAEREKECHVFCVESIAARALPMKLIRTELSLEGNKMTFYFSAEGRVDFRELLKDLVDRFHMRIELRQVGARQESAIIGGIGSCGRELCCASYLTNFQRISVKMAKTQNMTLNPTKISGLCGKLKCCLAYEQAVYAELVGTMPKMGKKVYLADGLGTVVSLDIIHQTFIAKLEDRRFVKCLATDMITEEEFKARQEAGEEKRPPRERPQRERPPREKPQRERAERSQAQQKKAAPAKAKDKPAAGPQEERKADEAQTPKKRTRRRRPRRKRSTPNE